MIKPGDFIEWVYESNNNVVDSDEMLWSTIERRWCHIGGTTLHLCVGSFDDTVVWLNDRGLFHARVDDTNGLRPWGRCLCRLFHARVDDTKTY